MKKTLILSALLFATVLYTFAQENLNYQKPSQEILELVDVPLAPSILMNNERTSMVLLYRDAYKSIEVLSKKELRLGGLRIDPATNIGSRTRYYNNVEIKEIKGGSEARQVKGLPEKPLLANFNWSPDQQKMAFTQTDIPTFL